MWNLLCRTMKSAIGTVILFYINLGYRANFIDPYVKFN